MPVGLRNLDAEMLLYHSIVSNMISSMKIHRASTYVEIIASLLQIEDEAFERIDAPCRK